MKTDKDEASQDMMRIFLGFESCSPQNLEEQWLNVQACALRLWESKWTRKEIYDLVFLIATDKSLSEECSEAAGEYLDALLGRVAPSCIARFSGEPSDPDELVAYVRGMNWFK